MNYTAIIGTTGASLTTVSLLPQVIKVWKTKHTKDLSFLYYIILGTGVALWVVYGIILGQPPIYIGNIVTLIFVLSVLGFKIKYG